MTALPQTSFPHHRLDAYKVSLQLLVACKAASDQVPRGYRSFADQLLRAAGATIGGITEGANRHTRGLKRDAFGRARAEVGEVAGHAEALAAMGLLPVADAAHIIQLADRVAALLTKLMRRQQ